MVLVSGFGSLVLLLLVFEFSVMFCEVAVAVTLLVSG